MEFAAHPSWVFELTTSTTALRAGSGSEFYRRARAGHLRRMAHGVYIPTATWDALGADDRYLAAVHAAALASRPGLVFSHHAAAALWRLPLVGRWPAKPEVTVGLTAAGPSRKAFTARQYPIPDVTDVVDGLTVTPLPRTLIDVGRSATLATSVAMMDRALAGKTHANPLFSVRVTRPQLITEFAKITTPRGRTRCLRALQLADGLSGSPGESLSRVGMHLLGLPAPALQHPFYDSDGLIGIVDFWWPECDLIGEFDGRGKYLRDLPPGSSTADAVIAEKIREDRLRACGPAVTRWGWDTARSLPKLARHLTLAGLA